MQCRFWTCLSYLTTATGPPPFRLEQACSHHLEPRKAPWKGTPTNCNHLSEVRRSQILGRKMNKVTLPSMRTAEILTSIRSQHEGVESCSPAPSQHWFRSQSVPAYAVTEIRPSTSNQSCFIQGYASTRACFSTSFPARTLLFLLLRCFSCSFSSLPGLAFLRARN